MIKTSRAVVAWITIGLVMLIVQVILGGVTRLTGSGLSITEWNVITGAIPPTNGEEWVAEFNKYKQTPQYQLLNTDFTIDDFKFIFFWEWLHRFWARTIGVVFIIGFIFLLLTRRLKREMIQPLLTLFLLGALQGAVGWIMVASGLTGDAVYVKPTRLALHFVFAIGLIAYTFWFLLVLTVPRKQLVVSPPARTTTKWLLLLTTIQLIFGALMAGHKAATAAPTWPGINGSFIPDALMKEVPVLLNFIENKITIHFVHRNLACIIFILTIYLTVQLYRVNSGSRLFNRTKATPVILLTVQLVLGVTSLITSPEIVPNSWGSFAWAAQLHQLIGMMYTLSLVGLLYVVRRR